MILRAVRESLPTTLLLAFVLMIVETALGFVLPKFGAQMTQEWLQMDFARGIMQAMVGAEIADRMGPQMFQAMAWVHPVVLALLWAHAMISGTRVPAAEVDRGTADVFLSLPVSRWEVFFSETIVWIGCAGIMLTAGLVGNLFGGLSLPPQQHPQLHPLLIVLANLFCLYFAAGGLAWFVSALSDRRGRAITIVFLLLLALFLLNYLAQFWHPLEKFVFLSPLHYHKPVTILASGSWPWKDMAVLLSTGGILWLCGGLIFARRDLCTV
ncbi:MAG TPA: ABC transporter permease subunit [Candidatus Eisenbacteria bacterium]|nr:ABC transporter permease subunit [Candidatus Eisenbacteria bacterium]